MRIRLQASLESPLLFLVPPLVAGILTGLHCCTGILSTGIPWGISMLLCFVALLFIQKVRNCAPLSRHTHTIFQVLVFYLMFCFGMLYAAFAQAEKKEDVQSLQPVVLIQMREDLCQRLEQLLPDQEHHGLIEAMLLGDRTELTREQKQAYRVSGISHLLALSGMHISFVMLLFHVLLFWCPEKLKKGLTLLGTWTFILLVGLPTSAVRAGFMLSCLLLNPFPQERTQAFDRVCLSALVMLFINPLYLQDIGFQLSFAAVSGILLFTPFFPKIRYIPAFIQEGVKICLCAQIAVLPLSLFYFHTLPVYFLFTNLLVSLILTPLILYLSVAVLLLGYVPLLGEVLCQLLQMLLQVQQHIVLFIGQLPGAQLTLQNFHLGALCCSYFILIILLKYLVRRDSKSIIQGQLALIALLICLLLEI